MPYLRFQILNLQINLLNNIRVESGGGCRGEILSIATADSRRLTEVAKYCFRHQRLSIAKRFFDENRVETVQNVSNLEEVTAISRNQLRNRLIFIRFRFCRPISAAFHYYLRRFRMSPTHRVNEFDRNSNS